MAKRLTERQKLVLNFLAQYIRKHGYPPSIREIGAGVGIKSLRGVTIHLDALEKKGYIRRERTSRSIMILRQADEKEEAYTKLPLLGAIAAGEPLLAVENIEGELPIPQAMLRNNEKAFLLRVKGDSMIEEHILPGDLVVIRPQQTAENGDLVAVLIGEEATVKRLRSENGEVVLLPANPAYEPITLRGKDYRIIGKAIALLRNF
ncbi:MAG: transcriptional repressor LexA [Armatimonadota bacterium]|nr:transcriptional repressor LexA [Armatimonadota bacterium]